MEAAVLGGHGAAGSNGLALGYTFLSPSAAAAVSGDSARRCPESVVPFDAFSGRPLFPATPPRRRYPRWRPAPRTEQRPARAGSVPLLVSIQGLPKGILICALGGVRNSKGNCNLKENRP